MRLLLGLLRQLLSLPCCAGTWEDRAPRVQFPEDWVSREEAAVRVRDPEESLCVCSCLQQTCTWSLQSASQCISCWLNPVQLIFQSPTIKINRKETHHFLQSYGHSHHRACSTEHWSCRLLTILTRLHTHFSKMLTKDPQVCCKAGLEEQEKFP